MQDETDVTKITLAGKEKLMRQMMEFIQEEEIKCWTDIGKTAFPIIARRNHRLDIMDEETSKGEAVKRLTKLTGLTNFMCIGNGPNDFSMFKFALDSGMQVVIAQNFENGEVTEESQDLICKVKEYARKIGAGGNVNVTRFPVNDYLGNLIEENSLKQKRKDFSEKIKIQPQISISKKGKPKRIFRTQDRGR